MLFCEDLSHFLFIHFVYQSLNGVFRMCDKLTNLRNSHIPHRERDQNRKVKIHGLCHCVAQPTIENLLEDRF